MARILVVGPHPDDQELGMGGTIIKLAQQGHDILILDVTNGEPTPLGSPEIRKGEAAKALEILKEGATGTIERWLLDLPNRFVEHTIENRHALAGVIRAWQATMIFTTFPEDAHPDHRATRGEASRRNWDPLSIPNGCSTTTRPIFGGWQILSSSLISPAHSIRKCDQSKHTRLSSFSLRRIAKRLNGSKQAPSTLDHGSVQTRASRSIQRNPSG